MSYVTACPFLIQPLYRTTQPLLRREDRSHWFENEMKAGKGGGKTNACASVCVHSLHLFDDSRELNETDRFIHMHKM